MGILLEQGWNPQLVIAGTSTVLNMYFSKYMKFNIADTRLIAAEMPLNGNRDFKYLGDHAEFVIRVNIWKHDSENHDYHGYTAQGWHDAFINSFYQVPLYFKTHYYNYNIKGKDGSTMEFMATGVSYGIEDTPRRETYMDITIKSLEYIDQTKVSVHT